MLNHIYESRAERSLAEALKQFTSNSGKGTTSRFIRNAIWEKGGEIERDTTRGITGSSI